jgi:hypothetical protein
MMKSILIYISLLDVDKLLHHIGKKRPHPKKTPPNDCTQDLPRKPHNAPVLETPKKEYNNEIHTPSFKSLSYFNIEQSEEPMDPDMLPEDISDEAYEKRHRPHEEEERRYYGVYEEPLEADNEGEHRTLLKICFDDDKNPMVAC